MGNAFGCFHKVTPFFSDMLLLTHIFKFNNVDKVLRKYYDCLEETAILIIAFSCTLLVKNNIMFIGSFITDYAVFYQIFY